MDANAHRLPLIAIICLVLLMPEFGQAQERATIWSFLGIPQAYDHLHGALTNRRGNCPAMEKKPALTGLADPENLESDVPIIKKAAEVKQAEDLKKQKIKAVKYLAEIGCGCYDTDGSVTEALLAASDDCTEEVRLATVEAIGNAASGVCCEHCGQTCCCKKDILLRLAEMAYERDDHGCFKEPSARVRQAAAETLRICCPSTAPIIMEDQVEPKVQPKRETVEEREDLEYDPPPVPLDGDASASQLRTNPRIWVSDAASKFHGVIVHANVRHRLAHVHLEQPEMELPVGTRLSVYQENLEGIQYQGDLEVVQTFQGSVNVRALDGQPMSRFQPGCVVRLPDPRVARHRN